MTSPPINRMTSSCGHRMTSPPASRMTSSCGRQQLMTSPGGGWLLVLVAVLVTCGADCPSMCECKWKNGKEAVLCLQANLTGLPPQGQLDASTQLLDLTGNLVASIGRDAFRTAGLLNLQKSIDRYAFRALSNLVELDLSYNALSAVPSHAFESISELRELKLSGNAIQRLLNDAFVNLKQLVRLEISDCRLATLELRAFNGLQRTLECLSSSQKVKGVSHCDAVDSLCPSQWTCSKNGKKAPRRLTNRAWDKLDVDEFACPPAVSALVSRLQVQEGSNASMSCQVRGSPPPTVHWLWKNKMVANVSTGGAGSGGKKLYVLHMRDATSRLSILSVEPQDAGMYYCVAENKAGRVQANISLAVTYRRGGAPGSSSLPLLLTSSWALLVASILVASLFLLAACLAVLCVCALRTKHKNNNNGNSIRSGHQSAAAILDTGGHLDGGGGGNYEKIELNHHYKPATVVMNHSGVPKCASNGYSEVAVVGPLKQHPRHSEYRGLSTAPDDNDADCEEEEEEEEEDEEEEDEDEEAKLEGRRKGRRTNAKLQATSAFWEESGVQQHVMRKEVLPSGTLYTTAGLHDERNNFPDLLGSPAAATLKSHSQDTSIISSTAQRFSRTRVLADRGKSGTVTSESQSPLLPGSRYSSSDSTSSRLYGCLSRSSSTYKLSGASSSVAPEDRCSSTLNLSASATRRRGGGGPPSLPSSPLTYALQDWRQSAGGGPPHTSETPILDILDPSIYSPALAATTYDYHAAQLERFLEEYRSLQEQLSKMKETCENLRLGGGGGKESHFENSRFADPPITDETPRSILKNKNKNGASLPQNASVNNPYWLPRDSIFDSTHNSDLFKS
ncbi:hypothetical protein LSTR_LSTR014458 [Laodelphax striatellus]|uniref:Ig-like domain-containing protein n=1 Tax=Laodelphax striatellus TaxID=195883 RepID=A0A482XCJ6_LAOST|nr:hypothetical protein LSTR_LSTR014458 [Laodelphax striatellus]